MKVNNYVDRVYSPDRVLYPMRRTGPKGSGRFERITWDDALDEIAARFRATIAEHGAEAIMPVSYLGTEGILNGLNVGDPFFNKLGATISRAHLLRLRRLHRVRDDHRRHRGRRPGEPGALPLHRHLGLQHGVDEPAPVAVHRRGAAARREGRGDRPGAAPAPRSAPTGTSRSGRAPTARSRWR